MAAYESFSPFVQNHPTIKGHHAAFALAHPRRGHHAAYIASWLKALNDDKRLIFSAAAHAQRAADFLHGLQPAPAPEPEPTPPDRDALWRLGTPLAPSAAL